MKNLCVVPCGKAKVWDKEPARGTTAARFVYTGSFATAARLYAEQFYPRAWMILSAKHGFLAPDELVPGPYEVTFNKRTREVITPARLAEQVVDRRLGRFDQVVVIAGRVYDDKVREAFERTKAEVVAPLTGLTGMGKMLAALREARVVGKPLRPLRRDGCDVDGAPSFRKSERRADGT